MDITSIIEDKPPTPTVSEVKLPKDNIFHLPSQLTDLQKWLVEVVLKLHKPSLNKMLAHGNSDVPPSLKEELQDKLTEHQLLTLLTNNWNNIVQHPYLLVDHFIPKNLILMESAPTLIRDSGKFHQLDKLINQLEPHKYNVVVVANTLKEIDLTESYLLGRRLNYKKYTGASLYDNNLYQGLGSYKSSSTNSTIVASSAVGQSSNGNTNSRGTNGISSANGNGSSLARRKKTDEYYPRLSKSNPQVQYLAKNPKDKLTIHLISSKLIKTMNFNDNLKFDLIISFDSFLSDLIYLRQTRSTKAGKLVPLVKLVLENSVEYFQLLDPELSLPDVICKAILHRNDHAESKKFDISTWLENYDSVQWPYELKDVKEWNVGDITNSLTDLREVLLRKKLKMEEVNGEFESLAVYKQTLTRMIKDTLGELSEEVVKKNEVLDPIRLKESVTQQEIETKNAQIADFVRLKQTLEVELSALTKRVEKLDADIEKSQKNQKFRNDVLQETDLGKFIEQEEDKSETVKRGAELEELNKLNESIRTEYQEASSKALELSTKLKFVSAENGSLKLKLNDNNPQLIYEKLTEVNDLKLRYDIEKLERQNQFLTSYGNKIHNVIKNNNITETGSSRATAGRFSRSATPRV